MDFTLASRAMKSIGRKLTTQVVNLSRAGWARDTEKVQKSMLSATEQSESSTQ
jgi:replicative DNA helicase